MVLEGSANVGKNFELKVNTVLKCVVSVVLEIEELAICVDWIACCRDWKEGKRRVQRGKEWLRGCGYKSLITLSIFSSIVKHHQETWNDTVQSVNMNVLVYI